MSEKKVKRSYRLPPCPPYDVEGMESWLCDMAREGWILTEDGIFCGVATFEKGEPSNMKYRLTAAPKGTSMWGENNGDPEAEEIEHSAMYGWEYIAKRGGFHIYRSGDPCARELNTDPEVQAMALKDMKKRQYVSILDWLYWAFIYRTMILKANILISAIHMKTWFALLITAVVVWFITNSVIRTVHLGRLRKKLTEQGYLDRGKNWKKNTARYHMGRLLRLVMIFVIIIVAAANIEAAVLGENNIPLSEYTEDPPFATIADFAEGEYELQSYGGWSNYVVHWSDWLAPECYRWCEIAEVHTENGTLDGSLYIDYYEAASPVIANLIAREYYREAKWDKDYEIFEARLPEGDFVVAYYDEIHMPSLILQRGNIVINVSFYQFGEGDILSFEEWTAIVAGFI